MARGLALLLCGSIVLTDAPVAFGQTQPEPATQSYPPSPHDLFDGLFSAVQSAHVYPDGKTFADAIPLSPPTQILAEYRAQHPAGVEALRSFLERRFQLPGEAATAPAVGPATDITAHI